MHKFILIRGHQGAGKSTFARAKIAEFQHAYPDAHIVHLENDLLLTDEQGVYTWSPEALSKAQEQNQTTFRRTLKFGQTHPHSHILIVHSNTNQKATACQHLLHTAQKHGFVTEVYRLHNFYPNIHQVKEHDVLAAYLKLNRNPLPNEIHLPAVQPMSDATRATLDEMQRFQQRPLAFDERQHTYVTTDYLHYGKRDFSIKRTKRYPELRVLKYKRHVFYQNRFNEALLEMRGLIIDEHHNIIVRPFKKVFNYSERIARHSQYPIAISDEHKLNAVVKVNGFLGCCTYVDLPASHPSHQANFNHQVLYSTTGSLDSDYAHMAQQHCTPYEALFKRYPNHTFLFEITDERDIHIIREPFGATLIGIIEVATGRQFTEQELDDIAACFNQQSSGLATPLLRPAIINNITFGDLKTLLKKVQHEGFMVFDAASHTLLFKLKSPYYLISKLLGRSNAQNLTRKLDKRRVDEEYYPLIDHIKAQQDHFNQLSELDKIAFIQHFLQHQLG